MSTLNVASVDNNVEADMLWAGSYVAGGQRGQLPPPGKLFCFSL